jgi:hypothetical protein
MALSRYASCPSPSFLNRRRSRSAKRSKRALPSKMQRRSKKVFIRFEVAEPQPHHSISYVICVSFFRTRQCRNRRHNAHVAARLVSMHRAGSFSQSRTPILLAFTLHEVTITGRATNLTCFSPHLGQRPASMHELVHAFLFYPQGYIYVRLDL